MGAWGVSPFENDNALDWVWSLEEAEDFSVLSAALDAVASQKKIIEDHEEALAAAEVVAALRGHPIPDLPEEVAAFLEQHGKKKPSPKLVKLAVTVVRRISETPSFKKQWIKPGDAEKWLQKMEDLLKRLQK